MTPELQIIVVFCVFIALLVTGTTLNMFSIIGFIMLMGLVTKNAILLVDFANQGLREGRSLRQALLDAGQVRLRPIIMTTLAMIFGMLPMAIGGGNGGETQAPMGRAIIGGVITSTLLTLVVVPVLYSYLVRERKSKLKPAAELGGPVLAEGMPQPMELEVAEDGRVFFIEISGKLRIWKPESRTIVEAGTVTVTTAQENGLLGFALTRSVFHQLGAEPGEAADLARSVAAGDLGMQIDLRQGDSTSLMAQLKTMQQNLAKVVNDVRQNSEAVATASAQIAQGNQDLSSRTEEQASALEETAASMEELSSTVKQNAEKFKATDDEVEEGFVNNTDGKGIPIELTYAAPTAEMRDARDYLHASGILEDLVSDIEFDFKLTRPTKLVAMSCKGQGDEGTFHFDTFQNDDPSKNFDRIAICYELVDMWMKAKINLDP